MRKAQQLSRKTSPETQEPSRHTKAVLEAMRRATEQATKGPPEMRSGRFNPQPKKAAE